MNKKEETGLKFPLTAFKRGMGLQKAMDTASEILGNPIIMFDIAFNLLAHTHNKVTDDYLWNELITFGKFSHTTVDFFNKAKFIKKYAESDVITYLQCDELKYDRANAKIFDEEGIQIADIIIIACYKDLEKHDLELFEELSEIITVELHESELYQNIKRVFPKSIVNDLLEGNISDYENNSVEIHNLYTGLKTNLYVAVVDVVHYEPTLTHLVYFMDLFFEIQKEYKYFVYLNNIVIIISTDNHTLNIKKDLKKLNEFFNKYNIYAGISDCFQNIFDLQKHYKHALNALNYGIDSRCTRHIFRYDDFRLDCFLSSIIGKDDLNILYNPIICFIKKHDAERGTTYIDIIYTYLLAGGNIAEASGVLKISRAELRKLLKEIENIFNVDWNDGNMIYSIFTTLKLLTNPLV